MTAELPEGARGRVLALGLLAVAGAALWLGLGAPLLGWYASRAEQVAGRRAMLAHEQAVAAALPALRRAASLPPPAAAASATLLAGDSDALAGAALQGLVQDMAASAGATLASTEVLPGEPQGALRRIGLRVALNAQWPVLVALLQAVEQSGTRLMLDDLQLHASPVIGAAGAGHGSPPVEASFVVLGLRAGRSADDAATGRPGPGLRAAAAEPGEPPGAEPGDRPPGEPPAGAEAPRLAMQR